jgi:hypothetical protein
VEVGNWTESLGLGESTQALEGIKDGTPSAGFERRMKSGKVKKLSAPKPVKVISTIHRNVVKSKGRK